MIRAATLFETPVDSSPVPDLKEPLTHLAPVLVLCATCHNDIRLNEILHVSFCPFHGFGAPLLFVPRTQQHFEVVTFG